MEFKLILPLILKQNIHKQNMHSSFNIGLNIEKLRSIANLVLEHNILYGGMVTAVVPTYPIPLVLFWQLPIIFSLGIYSFDA